MRTEVLDASVAAKWFLPPRDEGLVPQALRLFRGYDSGEISFIVPDIFWAEIANIAWKAALRQRWSQVAAVDAMRDAIALDFPTFPSKPLIDAAFAISLNRSTSLYDALYVALAERESAELVTADERLVKALGEGFPVRWLGSLSVT